MPTLVARALGVVAVATLATLSIVGCSSNPDLNRANPSAPNAPDGGAGPDAGACATAPTLSAVQAIFSSTCAGSTCHSTGPGGNFPPLADGPPMTWAGAASYEKPGIQLVVPGNPAASYLYMKVTGTQGPGGGALMPLGASMPFAQVSVIHDWIAAGAPTTCADADAGAPAPDPNTLDQATLFTCPAGAPPASSPARLRRIDSPEWTYALPAPLNGYGGSVAYLNPFGPIGTGVDAAYSTYSSGASLDTTTLDLYFQVLPEAPKSWGGGTGGTSLAYTNNPDLGCMFGGRASAAPSDTCIDTYVDTLLTQGVLFRTPTAAEHASLRAFLVTALATENGNVSLRPGTLALVVQAAWLTAAALLRTEIGSPVPNDPAKRSRLSNDELARAIGSMISFRAPGAPMIAGFNAFSAPSDPDDKCHPWLYKIREAADDGTLQDPAVIKRLITAYGGGVDPGGQPIPCAATGTTVRRRDQSIEYSGLLSTMGEYWLAPRIADFFRQWLDYGTADTVFKDMPGATSRFLTTSSRYDGTANGFYGLQGGGQESSLVQQLDDTIARTVIDAASGGVDVWKALMTTRLWHLPSDRAQTNTVTCTTNADCKQAPYLACTSVGLCGDGISAAAVTAARVYNVEGVPATDAGRWVTVPATERSGVLTHPAWLAAAGADNFQDDPNLIHRGKWVREHLFCETVPGLQLVMVQAALGVRAATLSARDRVHAAIDPNAVCSGCHQLMDSLGYPFEMYDAAGFLRLYDKFNQDAQGNPTSMHPPDPTSVITNLPDPALNVAISNAVDFAQRVSTSSYARRCFIRQAFRYFMGRDETLADQCTLASMETALNNGSFFDMLGALASSDSVLYRSATGGM